MFSAVDGFRTSVVNVANGYFSSFSSINVYSVMPDSTGSTLYLGGNASDDLIWLKINNNTGARITGQKLLGNTTQPDTGLLATKDSSDNVYLVGQSYETSTLTPAYISKLTSSGSITWQQQYYHGGVGDITGSYRDVACESGGGNIYCSGYNNYIIGGVYSAIETLVKYNSSGSIQTQEIGSYSNSGSLLTVFNSINDLTVDDYNKLYMTGYRSEWNGSTHIDSAALQKRYSNGVVEWDYALATSNANSFFTQSVVDSSNNVFYCGYYENDGGDFVGKLYSNGVQSWQKTYSNTNITTICLDGSGNVVAAGRLTPSLNNAFYINIDSSTGNINWQNFVNSSEANLLISDVAYANNFIYMGGYKQAYTGDYNGFTMKVASDGNTAGTYGTVTFSTANITASTSNLTGSGTALSFGSSGTQNSTTPTFTARNGSVTRKIVPL